MVGCESTGWPEISIAGSRASVLARLPVSGSSGAIRMCIGNAQTGGPLDITNGYCVMLRY